ncbi:MAG TPA: glucoamylase family protein [Clostridia bacterium]|nr:glucoamylase family protein [Clostridia bacterium]
MGFNMWPRAKDSMLDHGEETNVLYRTNKKANVKNFLLSRLDESFKDIENAYLKFNEDLTKGKSLPQGSEWILDNFYLIELIYKELKIDLKKEENVILNIIETHSLKGYPRIYALALELIYHSSGNISEETLIGFVNDFQKEEILTLEEIARFYTVLTLGLMEYIRNIVLNLVKISKDWEEIDSIDLSIETNLKGITENIHIMDSTKVERFIRRIREDKCEFQLVIEGIDKRLNYVHKSVKEVLEREYMLQSRYKVSLGYGISSIRNTSALNWERVFKSISLVERVFGEDPLEVYENMENHSKNYYRHETQRLAEKFKVQEIFISKKALEFAEEEWTKGSRDKRAHIGYYLIDQGKERLLDYFEHNSKDTNIHLGKYGYYYFPIILLSVFLTFLFSRYALNTGNLYWGILVFIVTLIPLMTISTNILNYFYFRGFKPKILPKIDYKYDIPEKYSTFVVIPTLLPDEDRVEELAKNLEVYYLSNRGENIYFGIVGDFKDGDRKTTENDEKIINRGLEVIDELNKKYSKEKDIFYFFHRERVYSETQEKWMGWERKRGALVEFNKLLLGDKKTTFDVISGDVSDIKIKYVITLDADTKLPIDGAKRLVGTISHPLNVAVLDEEKNVVKEGYGIIQPKISVDIESSNKSLFTRIFAGMGGIDPYSTAVSDIYQDLFGEGIFTGKGIYDLEVFQRCLKKEIPENTVLSHDLLEGSYVRVGLATDIELIDGYPEKYSSYIMRQHRWTRGDWQLVRWLRNGSISSLSKWKIMDNLRRSLVPISLFLILLFGTVFFPGNVFVWIGISLVTILLPIMIMALEYILYKRFRIPKMRLNGNLILGYKTYIYQGIFFFMFLPHKAMVMLDAIFRTLYRVFISKKNLLEWTTAFDMEKKLDNDISSYFRRMKENIISPILLIALAYIFRPDNLILSGIIGLLWAGGPVVAYIISKEDSETIEVKQEDIKFLADVGKQIWEYYKTFTDSKNNYLPPDNFQEYPYNGVINRTSPTNIGFYLMSILSGRDLGFITTPEMVDLVRLTIETLEKMEKWEGHLYNWYDTESLGPLRPIFVSTVDSGNFVSYLIILKEGLKEYLEEALAEDCDAQGLIVRIENLIDNTKFAPLYDEDKGLFHIGYNVGEDRVLNSYYDLLASEARTASYIAISRREVPLKHWRNLGRPLVMDEGYISLASWSGTMFEYLMPSLILKNYRNTLLDETYKTSIRMQKNYGSSKGVPWGISESGFFAFDRQFHYQYKAFGVPALGFKRGLRDELVISPYSTFLALKFDHEEVLENIKRLEEEGLRGPYGFYEAVDYTLNRLPTHLDKGIVKSYMSHHQGMIFASINNFINRDVLIDRFHRDPQMKCGEFLLQERVPVRPVISKERENLTEIDTIRRREEIWDRRIYTKEDMNDIKCHLLTSSTYTLMITNRGEGFSKDGDLFINRWRKDYLAKPYGQFIYIKDLGNHELWSTTDSPVYKEPELYRAEFSTYKASFYRKDGSIETEMDVFLLPEELGEIRRVRLTNNGDEEVLLKAISYFEVVAGSLESDLAHPAFNNLFIRTEALEEQEGLLVYRRKRGEGKRDSWILHGVRSFGDNTDKFQYETNRANFIGRGNGLEGPKALFSRGLTNTVGVVLDPIMSIGKKVKIQPKEQVEIYYITAVTRDKNDAIDILNKYSDINSIEIAEELSNTKSKTEIGYLNLNRSNIRLYENLLPYLFYSKENNKIRYADILKKNERGQEGLWAHGISGDNPIVLVTIKSIEGIKNLIELINAHEYWSYKGLIVDLVILNEDESIYYQPLHENIKEVVCEKRGNAIDYHGGIFIKNRNILEDEDRALLYKWARFVVKAEEGFTNKKDREDYISYKEFSKIKGIKYSGNDLSHDSAHDISLHMDYFNGYGGFSKDGKEYIIRLTGDLNTPLPWVNVISNKEFGFIVTEWGTGFTWADNSRENKLTPWYNDPIADVPGEIVYIRDDDTGEVWNITPRPVRGENDYITTHGQGYSKFSQQGYGLKQSLTLFTPLEGRIKINLIKLENKTQGERKLTLFYYTRPVLGVTDEKTENLLETDMKEDIFTVKNSTNTEFKNSTIFVGTSEKIRSYTGDRIEFIGHIPNYEKPNGVKREKLSDTVGLGYNPCSAIEIKVDIPANKAKEIVFLFGEAKDPEEGYSLINKFKDINFSKNALNEVKEFWNEALVRVQVKTPDNTMNYLMNSWLMYQNIACRMWGRAGFYQVGGAFGARDQMQDVTNALYHVPGEAREQIIRNCKHQYIEGDIQHWWHPIHGSEVHKGVRSRYSDDRLWVPLGVAEYISVTGDNEILHEKVPFIESPVLRETEHERYEVPSQSDEIGTVYEHCIRAIEISLNFGERGLPLMGSGDWNDGMNKIGHEGKGESVWMGWFLGKVLKEFIPVCEKMMDFERAERYKEVMSALKESIETNAWDGEWYKRAFFDDGTPIGSKESRECIIDSLAQSWSVISTLGDVERSKIALKSAEDYLVNEEEGIVALLTPPFDDTDLDPGYIKSYVPGVRENGGQYTHAAAWLIMAFAMLGEGNKAYNLFRLINPINHSRSLIECAKYKVEPYSVAADVYTNPQHLGRGGWTWYTGSAGWMYRVGLENILGFRVKKDKLFINPCIPRDWEKYGIKYIYGNTVYDIEIKNSGKVNRGVSKMTVDGVATKGYVRLVDDRVNHHVIVELG